PSAVSIVETVGSDSSSFTKGSSVESVAGKKRAPAKPCPAAVRGNTATISKNIDTVAFLKNFISTTNRKSFVVFATVRMLLIHRDLCKTLSGNNRGSASRSSLLLLQLAPQS